MKLSLIISLYNQTDVLQKVLAGVERQERAPDEILFADDGSAAPTRAIIETFVKRSKAPVQHVWHEDDGFRKTIIISAARGADPVQHDEFDTELARHRARNLPSRSGGY